MKPKILFAIAVSLCSASIAHCDDASRAAKAAEFLRVARMDETLRQSLAAIADQMKSGFLQQLTGVKVPPDLQGEVGAFQDKLARIVGDALSWDKIQPAYTKLYAETFSEEELDGMIAFYKSPAGQALVSKTPMVMTKSFPIVRERMAEVQPQIQKLTNDFMAEIKQRMPATTPSKKQ